MNFYGIVNEMSSMLYWSMLAACTVGPGTVVSCARAGAEYDLSLIWALIFGSILAFTVQEGSARLTVISGKSLGQCMRVKYRHTTKVYDTALVCWVVSIAVFIGNTLIEANCFAGGIDAVLTIPGVENTTLSVVMFCLAFGVVVLALLYWDKVDMLGIFLGCVMMSMIVLFLVVVVFTGLDFKAFGLGLIPNLPTKSSPEAAEPTDIILSLVGTTSLGFNIFLGGSMAKGKQLGATQRGIAFSCINACEVSVLILIVGSGAFSNNEVFTVARLADLIEGWIGQVGVWIFAIGFVAAALSSMLAVPLGAALTADSMFHQCQEEKESKENCTTDYAKLQEGIKEEKDVKTNNQVELPTETKIEVEESEKLKNLPRPVYWGIISIEVLVSVIVISLNAPRVQVILVAQVFNGCLLPFFAICLLLCINDNQFMGKSPQKAWANVFMVVTVGFTLFLAFNVLTQKLLGPFLPLVSVKLAIALVLSLTVMTLLCTITSLGKDLTRSFRQNPKQASDSSDSEKPNPADDQKRQFHCSPDMFINVFPPPNVLNVV